SDQKTWRRVPMEAVVNDRWRASFPVDEVGRYVFTVEGWVDHFLTWTEGIAKKAGAGVATETDLAIGSGLMAAGAERATGPARAVLKAAVASLGDDSLPVDERVAEATEPGVLEAMAAFPDRSRSTVSDRVYEVWVDRERARFSAWYELFPRSWGEGGQHGTFADVENHLEYISDMGFDVLYLPPIHPIGAAFRKGPNNTLESGPLDPGVPWAIGNEDGGHMAVHPDLGTLDDFRRLLRRVEDHGMEVALDIAFQCSPDHPWVEEHPEWFQHRPDGSIQYAENPPKKYEDIYPLD